MNTENPITQTDRVTLYYREGSSNKVYQCSIEAHEGGFVVNFAYGRRGAALQTGTKTNTPVVYDAARRIFDNLVNEKVAKGYTPGEDGVPYQNTANEGRSTGILPQLLNPIDEDEVEQLLKDPDWCLQEKKDGKRLLLQQKGPEICGINRKGLLVGLPSPLITSARAIAEDFLLDGECVGDRLYAFDLLHRGEQALLDQPYRSRWNSLADLLDYSEHPSIELTETAFEGAEKRAFLDTLHRDKREGVVFKRLDAPYTPGRPNSRGTQLKHKFYASLSAVVATINAQRSVELRLFNGQSWQSAGNVAIPANQAIPSLGKVVEIRYLYAYRESGALYQPVLLRMRDDLAPLECTTAQLKYRNEEEES